MYICYSKVLIVIIINLFQMNRNKKGQFESNSTNEVVFTAYAIFGIAVMIMCACAGLFQ